MNEGGNELSLSEGDSAIYGGTAYKSDNKSEYQSDNYNICEVITPTSNSHSNIGAEAPKPKKQRSRDLLFDAISEACCADPDTAGDSIGKVKSALLKANPPYTPDEVRKWRSEWPAWKDRPTLWQLKQQIGSVRANGHTPTTSEPTRKPGKIYT